MKRLTVFALAVSMLGCATARRIPTASGRPEVTIPIQGDAATASRLMRGDSAYKIALQPTAPSATV
jgi:hypothetical protein